MADSNSKGRRLKDLIEAPDILISPGLFDGYSARLVESRGFKVERFLGRVYQNATLAIRTAA